MKKILIAAGFLSIVACNTKTETYTPVEDPALALEHSRKRGEYLVGLMDCHACHSPKIMTPEGPVPDPNRLLGGFDSSMPLAELTPEEAQTARKWVLFSHEMTATVGPWGTSFAGNISSSETGLGNWSYEQFKKAITEGKYKGLDNTRPLLPPMPWQTYRNLKEEDIRAIYDYLKSTKPVENVVPGPRLAAKV